MRILLIEGDELVTRSIELMLKAEGVFVDSTDTGDDGLDLGKHYDYDASVLDIRLPDMSGLDAIRAFRRAEISAPILVLSDDARVETRVKILESGADGYMTKPFHTDELNARIRALVRRSRGHAQAAITTGMVTVNMTAKTVSANGNPIQISGKEYQILELLSLRRGATVNRDMFINHLYGYDEGPESRTIELFICRLRKKLAKIEMDEMVLVAAPSIVGMEP